MRKRTAKMRITYNGLDISRDISPHLVAATYTDNEGGQADELSITLEDRDGLWRSGWLPTKGAVLTAIIESDDQGVKSQLGCGTFAVDEIEATGPPDRVTIRAVSSLLAKNLRREEKTKGWVGMSLAEIGKELANLHGLSSYYNGDRVYYDRADQRHESDLAFLRRLASEADMEVKISGEKIIIFAGDRLEEAAASFTLKRGVREISSHRFTTSAVNLYSAAQVNYYDSEQKENITFSVEPAGPVPAGRILKINSRAKSREEAYERASRALRNRNKREVTAAMGLMGRTIYLAGLTGNVAGYGSFDGKYFVENATHTIERESGYTCSLQMRKVTQ